MILRRITQHVKAQNWTAVALDFVIVVVGVFVGLQVQGWAQEQDRLAQEAAYTQRLHDEVVDLQRTREPILQGRKHWHAHMQTARQVLFGETYRPLTEDECRGIAYNYFVSNPTADLGSLLELQSSGRIAIIRNEKVSKALQSFLLTRARAQDSQAQIAIMAKALGPAYPNLIEVVSPTLVESNNEVTDGVFRCDIEAMRNDPAFLQDFELAQAHLGFHINDNARVSVSLDELRKVLEDVQGISRKDDN